jgi:hypothetical protein
MVRNNIDFGVEQYIENTGEEWERTIQKRHPTLLRTQNSIALQNRSVTIALNLAFKPLMPDDIPRHGNNQSDASSYPSQHRIVTATAEGLHP